MLAFVLLITLPPGAPLRNPETGAVIGNSPFMDSLIIVIMLMFLAAGSAYGSAVGTVKNINDAIGHISKTIAGLGGLLFLFLVISQFLAYFNYTNMATIAAVTLGDLLESANIGAVPLLFGFVLMTTVIDVILGGAIPKWAIFAPIFVPLFMRLGVGPEVTLAAYRVGDSPVNPVTPLLAYFALIVVTAQKYRKDAGVGTIIAMMLPYTVAIWVVWTVLLILWYVLGIPLGIGTGDPRVASLMTTPTPPAPRPAPAEARQQGLLTTALILGVALVVALLASFVWPSSPSSEEEHVVGAVDVTGPVGRVGVVVTGPNTGGATDPTVELPGAGPGDYTQRPGTGSITAPIGGLEAALGRLATPEAALGGAVSGARATPTATRR